MDQNDIPANDKRKSLLTRIEEGLREYYTAPYRREFAAHSATKTIFS